MDAGLVGVADLLPRIDLPAQRLGVGYTRFEALAAEQGEFDLGHVQPASMLGRVVELQAVKDALGLSSRERLVETGRAVGVEVVEHDADAGELSLKLSTVRLDKLLPECAGMMARMAQARGITCRVTVTSASRVPVRTDEQRFRQVLLNLLSNAIKYNRHGGQVNLSCQLTRGGCVRLNVEDTGPGIPAEGLERLFVPFERLGQEMGEVEGTGLGLVVSRQLMEAMCGSLHVKSQVGKGSTFRVELPVAANTLELAGATNGSTAEPMISPEAVRPATVLYIEDNVSNVQVIQTVISRLRPPWRVLSARDGQGGLQLAREHLPDVILLDLQLPGMNGDLVLAEMRKDRNIQHIPVLLLSADATAHSRERLLALGANDYLSKPFDVAQLLERLDALLLVNRL